MGREESEQSGIILDGTTGWWETPEEEWAYRRRTGLISDRLGLRYLLGSLVEMPRIKLDKQD